MGQVCNGSVDPRNTGSAFRRFPDHFGSDSPFLAILVGFWTTKLEGVTVEHEYFLWKSHLLDRWV